MSDPFRGPPGTNPPRHFRQDYSSNAIGWTLGAIAAAVILGFAFFAAGSRSDRTAANPPAVITTPAPAARVPAPPPETTTGQSIPRQPLDQGNGNFVPSPPAEPYSPR
jgi:hypothetical protein